MAYPLLSLMLAGAVSTVPYLVSYQGATISDAQGDALGEVLLGTYTQVDEAGSPRERQMNFRNLLERVQHQYGESDLRERAMLVKEFLELLAPPSRYVRCGEVVLRLELYSGVRYRVCVSPDMDIVRLVEDLTTPERISWLVTVPDPEKTERARAALEPFLTKLTEAADDLERLKEAEAEIRRKIDQMREEFGPEETGYMVHELEVNGAWEEFSRSGPGQAEEALTRLWSGISPEVSSRFALLFCFLEGLREGEYPQLTGSTAANFGALVLDDLDLDPERLPFSCQQKLHLTSGADSGPLPGQFLPLPDSLAEKFYPNEKWDPPKVGLSFEGRVKRLQSGKGW